MKKIGLIFAMNEELEALKKHIKIENTYNIAELTFYEGICNQVYFVLVESGVGKVNAARTTQILIDNANVDCIFNIGVAGGIQESLHVGDIVVATSLVQHDFDITAFHHEKGYIPKVGTYIETNKELFEFSIDILNKNFDHILSGVIASGDCFCTDERITKEIAQKFNALCVEMEGAAIAQICYLAHIPFLVIRSISDVPNNNNVITYEQFLTTSAQKVASAMEKILNAFD